MPLATLLLQSVNFLFNMRYWPNAKLYFIRISKISAELLTQFSVVAT